MFRQNGLIMEILGIGPLEFLLIVLLALILLGPKELVQTGRKLGEDLRKLVRSETWQTLRETSDHIQNLPNRLIREAGLEEIKKETDHFRSPVKRENSFESPVPPENHPPEIPPPTEDKTIHPPSDPRG